MWLTFLHCVFLPLLISCLSAASVRREENQTVKGGEEDEGGEVKYFDNIIASFMRERNIPGASVAISKNGKLIFKKGYGRAGMYRWVTPWSLFRIGSVSKPITAMGVLRATEMNLLRLDQHVFGQHGILNEYTPTEKGDQRLLEVQVKHLLQHTAGWDQAIAGDPLMWRGVANSMGIPEPPDHHTLLIYMMSQSLQFTPGERYAYSNLGYMILGRIIERVTHMSYDVFIRKQLQRVGIYSMKLGHTRKDECDLTEVEYFADYPSSRVMSVFPRDGLVSPPYGGFCMENMDSTGGWIASSQDLVRFFDALNSTHHRLLQDSTFSQMLEQPEYAESSSWYGMGVVVQDGGSTWWHSGVLDGSTSILTHDATGFTWAVLLNFRLHHNDLDDLIKFAIRCVPSWYGRLPVPLPPLAESVISSDGKSMVKLMIPEHQFPHVRDMIISRGFRLNWIDAFTDSNDQVHFNTIWQYDKTSIWKVYHGLSSSAYRRKQRAKTIRGYRLSHVEAYISGAKIKYAAIFIKESWPAWVAYHGYSPHRHKETFHKMFKDGFRLVVQSVVEFKGKLYVSALYDRLNLGEFRVRMGLTPKQFSQELDTQTKEGRVLSYIQAYTHRGLAKISAIWGSPISPHWAVLQDATKYVLFNKLYDYAKLALPLACITAYDDQGVATFTALWL